MRYVKPLAVIVTLVAISSASADGIDVLVEPLVAASPAPAAPGAAPAKPAAVFRGKLLKPTIIVLSSGDTKTAGSALDLNKVFVLTFPTVRINEIDSQLKAIKDQLAVAIAQKEDKLQTFLANQAKALGEEKARLQANGIVAITQYKTGRFAGYFDETKEKVKFLIEKAETSPNAGTDPPTEYTQDQLRAIYFLPQPAAPAKATPSASTGETKDPAADDWWALFTKLEGLRRERLLLAEKFVRVHKQCELMDHLSDFEWATQMKPASKKETLDRLKIERDALESAIHAKDLLILQSQIQLAFRAGSPPEKPPEPYEAFLRTPCVHPVPECDDPRTAEPIATMAAANPYGSLEQRIARLHSPAFNKRFDQPAHFPMPRFGLYGERLDTEGLLIYEGMRFVATRDGQYEVSFSASIPKMAVTLRLQLICSDATGCTFTLTLPPIVIDPQKKSFTGNYPGASYQVYHAGFSHMVAEHFADLRYMTVVRQGTARFGSWPEGINNFETLTATPVPVQTPEAMQPMPPVP